jgi:O-antigen biosynthesis protein
VERVLFAHRVLPALRPDVAQDPGPFSEWVERRELRRHRPSARKPPPEPLHIVMVVAGEPPPETVRTLHALQQQTAGQWSLTVVVQRSWQTAFIALLAVSGLQRSSRRVRVECADDASPASAMLDLGLSAARGAALSLLFPGDVWAPDAVAQIAGRLSPRTVVYADEDSVAPDGRHVDPRLKPVYSPEFLLSSSYVGRPLAIGSELARHLTSSTDSLAQAEHDLALRSCELADEVMHLPEVLCHRLVAPPDAPSPGAHDVRLVAAAIQRRGEAAEVSPGSARGTYRIRRRPSGEITATIIVPFRDEPRLLRTCIESIDATHERRRFDFLLVDNDSVQPETLTLVERLARRDDVTVLKDDRPFNWSALNNTAAKVASGDVLIFLNNDIEAREPGGIDVLSAQAMRPGIGAVGARLVYPDGRLQHCGVVIGLGGAAGHPLAGLDAREPGYLNMAISTRECAAVTGACLATRRVVFESLGGFDEALGVDLSDVDYCLRAQRAGMRVLCEGTAELVHHESPSRGFAGGARDIGLFVDRWRSSIDAGDPYLNPNLTRIDSSCALRGPDEGGMWDRWYASLSQN